MVVYTVNKVAYRKHHFLLWYMKQNMQLPVSTWKIIPHLLLGKVESMCREVWLIYHLSSV